MSGGAVAGAARPRVVCIGDVMIDVLARLPGPLRPATDTPGRITTRGGGAGANVAAWLASAGVHATFVGRVGDDAFGRQARTELERLGVIVEATIDRDRPTGVCIVLVGPDGERTMVPDRGANDGGANDGGANGSVASPALLDGADALYLSGYTLLGAASRAAALSALDRWRAGRRDRPVVVDAASAAPLREAPEFLDVVGTGVLLLANRDEATVLTAHEDPDDSVRILAGRCGAAIVKAGRDGAVWSDGRSSVTVPAAPARLVDSTGAGDAFAAGFLAAQLSGAGIEASLAAGAQLAAGAVEGAGARPASTSRADRP